MYNPPRDKVEVEQVIDAFIRENGFATLVSSGADGIMATHIPLELERNEAGARVLKGHVSKANAQWKQLEETGEAMAIFLGPHAYISPTWYDHPNVPTWNYQAVHAYGTVRIFQAQDTLKPMLRSLSEHYEPKGGREPRFDLDAMPDDLRTAEMKGIVAFEMLVTRMDAAFKLSQNRTPEVQANIIRELNARGDDASRAIANAMMEKNRP